MSNSFSHFLHSSERTVVFFGSGARARQFGQTPYIPRRGGGALRFSSEPCTTLQYCGGRCWISSQALSTPTLRWLMSSTAWRSLSSITRYHAPRDRTQRPPGSARHQPPQGRCAQGLARNPAAPATVLECRARLRGKPQSAAPPSGNVRRLSELPSAGAAAEEDDRPLARMQEVREGVRH